MGTEEGRCLHMSFTPSCPNLLGPCSLLAPSLRVRIPAHRGGWLRQTLNPDLAGSQAYHLPRLPMASRGEGEGRMSEATTGVLGLESTSSSFAGSMRLA